MNTDVDAILAQLREAGNRRNTASRHTPEGLAARAAALADIRAYAAEARRLKVTHERIAAAIGVKHAQWFNILNGKTRT
jgi:hypothetical protein